MKRPPEFCNDATNVYRTNNFIVKQVIGIHYDSVENNVLFSQDTYYRRNKRRDAEYELVYRFRKNINGKRLPTSMYSREYID